MVGGGNRNLGAKEKRQRFYFTSHIIMSLKGRKEKGLKGHPLRICGGRRGKGTNGSEGGKQGKKEGSTTVCHLSQEKMPMVHFDKGIWTHFTRYSRRGPDTEDQKRGLGAKKHKKKC